MNCFLSKKLTYLLGISLLTSANLVVGNIGHSYAETCTAFPVVGGQEENETEITKTVSQPGVSIQGKLI
ncbi:hypothetical protein [Crocosphaera sp. Alani8]|uniref:hypothetical protein n=1 Tax=Crocosphaera sp. Alani8 TaxID=3038952 RepID=UPI00313B2E16